jgi:hypothetical protein
LPWSKQKNGSAVVYTQANGLAGYFLIQSRENVSYFYSVILAISFPKIKQLVTEYSKCGTRVALSANDLISAKRLDS